MTSPRLQVIIVGAGLGGLAAGAFLREFADVTILESARELKEIGAAVGIGGGAGKILRRFGICIDQEGGMLPNKIAIWTMDGNKLAEHPPPPPTETGEPLVLIHRADLHAALARAATKADGPGKPCQIILNHKITSVDAEAGVVTAENGSTFSADVVIGADGIRSNTRSFVVGDVPLKPSGESAYRLLIHAKDLPENHPLLVDGKIAPTMHMVKGHERKIIAYPIREGAIMNLVALIPSSELHEEISEKWTAKGSIEAMVQSYSDAAPFWKDILRSGTDVGVWRLCDVDPLETWVKGRTILIGDAAHAMLPHKSSGTISAIEDAEALHLTLRNATRETAHDGLQRAFRMRYKRSMECQAASRKDNLFVPPNPRAMQEIFAQWEYPGAERWETDRPDMIWSA